MLMPPAPDLVVAVRHLILHPIYPMFIEAICQYRVQAPALRPGAVGCPYVSALDEPIYDDEYLLTCGAAVQLFDGLCNATACMVALKYKCHRKGRIPLYGYVLAEVMDASVNCFKISGKSYTFQPFLSLFAVSSLFYDGGRIVGVISTQDCDCQAVLVQMEREHGPLKYAEGIYSKKESRHNSPIVYSIQCKDGKLRVMPELIKSHALRSASFADSIRQHVNFLSDYIVFEKTAQRDYVHLIRDRASSIHLDARSCITHAFLHNENALFFTVFAVFDGETLILTVFLSRALYNLVHVYNALVSLRMSAVKLLGINYFPHSRFALAMDGRDLLIEYRLPCYDVSNILHSIYANKSLIMRHDSQTFWTIMYLVSSIKPLALMSLVITDITPQMHYLMDAPYSFIVSTTAPKSMHPKAGASIRQWIKPSSRYTKAGSGPKYGSLADHAHRLLEQKLDADLAFPLRFNHGELSKIELSYLHTAPKEDVCYVYDIDKGTVFLPRVYIRNEAPLKLWVLWFDGELDYDELIRHEKGILPYLSRRACYDRDSRSLAKVLNASREQGGSVLRDVLANIGNFTAATKHSHGLLIERLEIVSRCACYRSACLDESLLSTGRKMPSGGEAIEAELVCTSAACHKHTTLHCNGKVYDLMSTANVLSLMMQDAMLPQAYASMVAYFQVYNLPLTNMATSTQSKYSISVKCSEQL